MPRFLEVSLSTDQIIKDMAVYADIGFEERAVNEIVSHHYGVLGDDRFHLGLHEQEFSSPTITYVLPNLSHFAPKLGDLVELEQAVISDTQFNHLSLIDPNGQRIRLIEARTFSPTFSDNLKSHGVLGRFMYLELPHTTEREDFWMELERIIILESSDGDKPPLVRFNSSSARLTAVYSGDLDNLIMHSAQQGWQNFAVTEHNHGLFRTRHNLDIRIEKHLS